MRTVRQCRQLSKMVRTSLLPNVTSSRTTNSSRGVLFTFRCSSARISCRWFSFRACIWWCWCDCGRVIWINRASREEENDAWHDSWLSWSCALRHCGCPFRQFYCWKASTCTRRRVYSRYHCRSSVKCSPTSPAVLIHFCTLFCLKIFANPSVRWVWVGHKYLHRSHKFQHSNLTRLANNITDRA